MSLSTKTYFEYNDIHTNPNEMWLLFYESGENQHGYFLIAAMKDLVFPS